MRQERKRGAGRKDEVEREKTEDTTEGDTASGASQRKADAMLAKGRGRVTGKREETMCASKRYSRWNSSEREDRGVGKGGRRARFLVYRGINPYPQLPFVLGAAWSTC